MLTTRARRALHRCLTLLFALSLGARLVVHECPAHDLVAGAGGHAAMGHGSAMAAADPAASGHAGHHGVSEVSETSAPVSDPAPHCTCAGDCVCAARDGCAPARPTIALATVVEPAPRVVVAVPAPRTDRGARLLPFANGPPVMRALLA